MNLPLTMIGLASAFLAAIPLWTEIAADPINAANFARIKEGMTCAEIEKILGSQGDESSGDARGFSVSWQGRGRKVILVYFNYSKEKDVRASNLKVFFNPSLWDLAKEWWGGYELHPDGSRSKRLKGAA